jgi:hypothetical protein
LADQSTARLIKRLSSMEVLLIDLCAVGNYVES